MLRYLGFAERTVRSGWRPLVRTSRPTSTRQCVSASRYFDISRGRQPDADRLDPFTLCNSIAESEHDICAEHRSFRVYEVRLMEKVLLLDSSGPQLCGGRYEPVFFDG